MFRKTVAVILAAGMILGLTACGGASNGGASVSVSASASQSASKTETSVSETITADRTIAVEEVNGTVTADDAEGSFNPIKGEHLKSGMQVATAEASDLTLLLDSDKHAYAAEKTKFSLEATGGAKSTKTIFNLLEGTLRSVIDNKLESEETYEVTTPNATMAVRGTDFTVTVTELNGEYVTTVTVDDGAVWVRTTVNGEEVTSEITKGEGCKITDQGITDLKEESKSKVTREWFNLYYNSGELAYSYSYVSTYDENGYLVKKEFLNDEGVVYWYEYENDENGRLLMMSMVYPDGSGDHTKYEYDANGNKIRAVTLSDYGYGEEVEYEYAYSYDAKGNLIEEKCLVDEVEHNTYTQTYAYDEKGNKIRSEYQDEYSSAHTSVWEYDSEGRLISYVQTSAPDGTVSEEWSEIKHDDKGNVTEYLYSLMGISRYRHYLSYDDNGNLIKETEIDVNTGGTYCETGYEYAEDGE